MPGRFARGTTLMLLPLALSCGGTTESRGPCAGVDCSGHGVCVAVADSRYCWCAAGYVPVGSDCVRVDGGDACALVDCEGHGTCWLEAGATRCRCESGWEELVRGHCIQPSPDGGPPDGEASDAADGDSSRTDEGGEDMPGVDVVDDIPPPPTENCANGVDDDGDGATDCGDGECDMQACGGGNVCRGGVCGCPGGSAEYDCQNGRDDDCDGPADCADSDCAGAQCANDGEMCGTTLRCHVCRGGACMINSPDYDDACTPSCGTVSWACGRPTFCCGAGAGCVGGVASPSYGCPVCCFDGCCATWETDCGNGLDDDCDTSTDCADANCDEGSCPGGHCHGGTCCTAGDSPCLTCACGYPPDPCGGNPWCGDCSGDICVDCTCYPP
jgi:hypothetical protein